MGEIVVPNEMARALGITGLQFRNWLRAGAAAGHPLLASHQHGARWEFTRQEADQLMAEYREGRRPATSPQGEGGPRASRAAVRRDTVERSEDAGHRLVEEWMGEEVETLEDLLKPGLSGVVVGINPSPVSVAAGHYYQGRVGQTFFRRLAEAGVLPQGDGFEDDRAFAAGLGLTDVVKRPTPRAADVTPEEMEHGRALLEAKLRELEVPRVLFTFKGAAVTLLGEFDGHGLRPGAPLAGAEVFVMPGPYEARDRVRTALEALAEWWEAD